jgi:hypothetical protein
MKIFRAMLLLIILIYTGDLCHLESENIMSFRGYKLLSSCNWCFKALPNFPQLRFCMKIILIVDISELAGLSKG